MPLDLDSLEKAIRSLEDLSAKVSDEKFMNSLDETARKGLKAGVIQNFEFTYELCWKMMKRWIETNAGENADGVSRRELFRMARESRLIDDIDGWMVFHEARNRTSHTYNEAAAEEVFAAAIKFKGEAKRFFENLRGRND